VDNGSEANPVQEVATSVPAPWTARQIATAAGTDLASTVQRLEQLLGEDELVALDLEGQRRYYPDPIQSYLDATGGEPTDATERAALQSVQEAITEWERSIAVQSVEGFMRYHHATRLVASSLLGRGFDIFDADWDVLAVLDTCRVDALRAVVDRLDGVDSEDVAAKLSVGSQTAEWLCRTFTADHSDAIGQTGYVSGNGWVKGVFEDGLRPDDDAWFRELSLPTAWDVVDGDALGTLVHAWRRDRHEYSRDVPWAPHPNPGVVTDHAIALGRERADLDQLVVHYKQPHAPYTIAAEREGRTDLNQIERAPFDHLAAGGDREDVWEAYLTDLRAAVDGVETLRQNVDGTIAITADHGEAFGEHGEYGHRPAMLHPEVRQVPWVTVEATDEGTREGNLSAYEPADRDVSEQLDALGYR
jgi:hypothetical protein